MASQVDISKAVAIGGWMSEKELTWLATQASKCMRIVEFGSHHGRSTRAIADNAPEGAKIWAVDPWGGRYLTDDGREVADINTYVMPYFIRNLNDHIQSGKVIPVRNFSYNFTFMDSMDMVFLDGDHRYETVKRDINIVLSILPKHGLICGHDYGHPLWPGVKMAVDELLSSVNVVETIWWTRKF